jgi:hypothetical protein
MNEYYSTNGKEDVVDNVNIDIKEVSNIDLVIKLNLNSGSLFTCT